MQRDIANGKRAIGRGATLALALVLGSMGLPALSLAQPPARPNNAADCHAHGGNWKKVGLAGVDECDLPTADAGRACSDDSECEAACVTSDSTPPGSAATGHCYPRTTLNGQCLNHVRGGKALGLMCAD